jgi:hypothetical protein
MGIYREMKPTYPPLGQRKRTHPAAAANNTAGAGALRICTTNNTAVLGILVDTEFQALAKRLVELPEVVLILRDFYKQIIAILDE